MSIASHADDLLACLLRADRPAANETLKQALAHGAGPAELLLEVVQPAMYEVGLRWSQQQASLTQYFVAGRIADDVTNALVPLLEAQGGRLDRGRVLIGTIAGDYHGLGRKIVAAFLRAASFEVRDLGLGVTPEQFVAAAVETGADVIGVSALMLHAAEQIARLKPLLVKEGLGAVPVIVGGAPFNYHPGLYREYGAEAMACDAGEAVRVVEALLGKGGES